MPRYETAAVSILWTGIILLGVVAFPARGGVMFTTLFSFDTTNGAGPLALVQGMDGNFYGTCSGGGIGFDGSFPGHGTVFKLTKENALANTVWFDGTNGSYGANLIQGVDGSFYGTTLFGGSLFKLNSDGTMANPEVVSFVGDNGAIPVGLVQDREGNLYGTTEEGGESNYGTVFKVSTNDIFTSLAQLNGTNGVHATALIRGADANFYGLTQMGGEHFLNPGLGFGTVFVMTPEGSLTSLFSFGGTNGDSPDWITQGSDGALYGSTTYGGDYDYGTIFKLTTNGTLVWSFSFNGTNGASPRWIMEAKDGNLYGTANSGGEYGAGTVYRITTDGVFTSLVQFEGTNGAQPFTLIQASDGSLYGTTERGGAYALPEDGVGGTIFHLSIPMQPRIRTVTQTNNTIALDWDAASGFAYQIQTNGNLFSTNWNNLGTPILATNGVISASDILGSDSTKFYRVVLLQ